MKRCVDIPIIAVGRITDVNLANQIVRDGHADLVAMGRASLADPELVSKAAEGRWQEIRHCLGCTDACMDVPIRCNNNPELGREATWDLTPVKTPKRVWVVGGGVSGLEAATLAARRGHMVTLFEKESKFGGQMHAAAAPPHKQELYFAISDRIAMLEQDGVELRTDSQVTADTIRQGAPDAVILSTGASPVEPQFPGADRPEVVQAKDVLVGKSFVGPRVAVIGGGMVGAETAEYLADRRREVTIIEMQDAIATDMPATPRAYLVHRLRQLGVCIMAGAKVEAISEYGVMVSHNGLHTMIEGFSSYVLAMGSRSNDTLFSELSGEIANLHIVGDAKKVARIVDATSQAAEAALLI
jgi:pyruvate/2-oxoglutarate dehydrogenase complex dihydrolipoamide dehydrogenase (E3) component